MGFKFTKMHGLGNDYIYFNCLEQEISDPNELARIVSDRHFGIGGDGIVLICSSDIADFQMKMFNMDGTQAEMCGNAIRCVGKYVYHKKLTDKAEIKIETLSGIKTLYLNIENGAVHNIKVNMGEPILSSECVPVLSVCKSFVNQLVKVMNSEYFVTAVSMGNPHAVLYVKDVVNIDISVLGPAIENHVIFPERTNVDFVEIVDRETVKMRVWERGSGETYACGTGACAAVVAGILNDNNDRSVVVKLKGGDLCINWNKDDNCVYMSGPAEFVFEGEML